MGLMEACSAAAAKKLRPRVDGWHAWLFRACEPAGLTVTGAVCPRITRGPNTGKPNFRKKDPATQQTVYLSARECRRISDAR